MTKFEPGKVLHRVEYSSAELADHLWRDARMPEDRKLYAEDEARVIRAFLDEVEIRKSKIDGAMKFEIAVRQVLSEYPTR